MLHVYFADLPASSVPCELSVGAIAASLWAGITYRLGVAILTIPDAHAWAFSGALLLVYALISLPIGFYSGFVRFDVFPDSRVAIAGILAGSLLMPGISEELFFRVLLLPHPTENASLAALWLWGCIGLVIFLIYHPLNILALGHDRTFRNPVFLLLAALLGIACTLSYWQSGSLWPPVIIHWLIVVVWLLLLGGYRELHS